MLRALGFLATGVVIAGPILAYIWWARWRAIRDDAQLVDKVRRIMYDEARETLDADNNLHFLRPEHREQFEEIIRKYERGEP
jgi:hypothetical protein